MSRGPELREAELPPLANYLDLTQYKPLYGDIVLWAGWFSCWTGVVSGYDEKTGDLSLIFGGLPFLLFTMEEREHERNTTRLSLSQIRRARPGTFSIIQHDTARNTNIWYV